MIDSPKGVFTGVQLMCLKKDQRVMCDGVPFLGMTNRGLRWNDWFQEVASPDFPTIFYVLLECWNDALLEPWKESPWV